MSNVRLTLATWLAACALVTAPFIASGGDTGFLNRTIRFAGMRHRYQVYVPSEYTPSRAWPVILFLHGSGERGTDGVIQTEVGLGTALRRHAERFPAIVVFPQAPPDTRWPGASAALAMAELAHTEKEFRCDPRRVYLTGISMGGNGAWYLAYRHPERFAAVVPICGWFLPNEDHPTSESAVPGDTSAAAGRLAERLRGVPIWIFHGGADPVISPHDSRRVAAVLDSLGAPAKYTEYPGLGHGAWEPAYADPELASWLFAQRRPAIDSR